MPDESGMTADWRNVSYPADRTVTFHERGGDEIELSAVCGIRCKRCTRYIAWVWDHPEHGHLVVYRVPLQGQENHPLRNVITLVRSAGGGNVKADWDSLPFKLDTLNEYEPWCVECRERRTISRHRIRAAITNGDRMIRAQAP